MNFLRRLSGYRVNGLSIKARLGLGISLLLLLHVISVGTVHFGRRMVVATEATLTDTVDIQRLVLEMNRQMEKVRYLHASFFLHAAEIGLTAAQEQYVRPAEKLLTQVVAQSKTLKDLLEQSDAGKVIHSDHVDMNLYFSSAQSFAETSMKAVEMYVSLHSPDSGLEQQLDLALQDLAAELKPGTEPESLFLKMKYSLLQYRILRQRTVMDEAFNTSILLLKSILADPQVSDSQHLAIDELVGRIHGILEKILVAEAALQSHFRALSLQAEGVDSVSLALEELVGKEVNVLQKRLSFIRVMTISTTLTIMTLGLLLAFFVARMLNFSVIRRISRLNKYAGELREGNLAVVVPEDSTDELGQLAHTFNLMTARIRELVGSLESKVEQRTAELSVSEKRFHQLFENSSNGVMIYDPGEGGNDFIITDCNKAAEVIEQLPRQEIIGRRVTEVFPGVQESGLLDLLCRVRDTGEAEKHPVSFYHDTRISGWRQSSVYQLSSGELVCIYNDCTAQKQAEAEKQALEGKWQRAQKMEAIGLMAGGVAHDLNNILSGIVGFPDVLLRQLPMDSNYRRPVQIMKESGRRAAAMVSDLLTAARGVVCDKEPANFNSLIEEYLDSPDYQQLSSRHSHVLCSGTLAPDLPLICCSTIHIRKCIMNLVSNAMESMNEQGYLILSTGQEIVPDEVARQNKINPGLYVVLSVTDTGKGIAEKDLEHIFEPFYSKKVMGVSGTGLGLTIVWNTVMDHGGMIQVKSSPRGTTFLLYFPASEGVAVSETSVVDVSELRGNQKKILVVDDDAMLRELAVSILTDLDYEVVSVSSGEEALAYLAEHRVNLVLLDMVMAPGISGLETYRRILTIDPGLKTVIVTGFSESDDMREVRRLGVKRVIKKPYSFEQLGQYVSQELSS